MNKAKRGNGGTSNGIFDGILAMAASLADSRRDNAASMLGTFAGSVRGVADAMPDMGVLREYAGAVAESLEGLADYVIETDIETLASDAGDFMRQHPVVTITGSVAAGLVVAQIVKANMASSSGDEKPKRARRKSKKQKKLANA